MESSRLHKDSGQEHGRTASKSEPNKRKRKGKSGKKTKKNGRRMTGRDVNVLCKDLSAKPGARGGGVFHTACEGHPSECSRNAETLH